MSNTAAKSETEAKEDLGGTVEADVCCANCGAAEIDEIKLEECNGCDLVKYCSNECREEHLEQHEEECKNRKALLHDRKLLTQPDETHLGECPICFLPMPLDPAKSMFSSCCSESICNGCFYANSISNLHDKMKALRCPFCREVADDDENDKRMTERIKANDPAAMSYMGGMCYNKGDYNGAFEYYTNAAELGDLEAHFKLGVMRHQGKGVERDEEKAVYHLEQAAIGGHHLARNNLGWYEERNGNMGRAVKHYIIAANLGYEDSMKTLWAMFKEGYVTKEDLDATLRSHQAAIDAMKSAQRGEAEASGAFSR